MARMQQPNNSQSQRFNTTAIKSCIETTCNTTYRLLDLYALPTAAKILAA